MYSGRSRSVVGAGVVVACLAGLGVWYVRNSQTTMQSSDSQTDAGLGSGESSDRLPEKLAYATTAMTIGGQEFVLDVADTPDKQRLGLGERDALPPNRGMLFVYADEGERCFWMKDMRFALDIIWLDANKRVAHIEHSLAPDTYPQTYCPAVSAKYAIELSGGTARIIGLEVGGEAAFNL